MSNAFYIFLNWLTISVLNFLYWIVAGKLLLSTEYGIASTVFALASIVSNLSLLGIDSSLRKLIPEYQAKNQRKKLLGIIRFSFKVFMLTNVTIAIVMFILTPFLSTRVFRSEEISLPLYVTALAFPIYTLGFLTNSILFGFQDMKTIFTTTFIGTIVKNIISIVLIFLGFTYFGPIGGFFIGVALAAFLRLRKIKLKNGEVVNRKEIFAYSFAGFLDSVNFLILTQLPPIILSSLSSIEATGIYTLAYVLATPISIIPQTLSSSSFPVLSQLYGKKDKVRIKKVLSQVFRYSLFMTLPFSFILLVFPRQAISLVGNISYMNGYMLLPLLAFANLILGIGNFFLTALYALGKPKLSQNIQVLRSIVFFSIALLFTKRYSFMAIGYAFLAVGTVTLLTSFSFLKRFYKIKIETKPMIKVLVSTTIFLLVLYHFKSYGSSVVSISSIIVLASAIYLLSLLLLRFFEKEDLKLLKDLESKVPRLNRLIKLVEKLVERFT